MNIEFSGKSFSELFHTLFDEIANCYQLQMIEVHNGMMELKGKGFSVLFTYDYDTSWIYYYDEECNKTYLISNYINVNAKDLERKNLPKGNTIAKEIEGTLIVQSRVSSRIFTCLLKGKNGWFEEYKNSPFFQETKPMI